MQEILSQNHLIQETIYTVKTIKFGDSSQTVWDYIKINNVRKLKINTILNCKNTILWYISRYKRRILLYIMCNKTFLTNEESGILQDWPAQSPELNIPKAK